MNTRTARTTLSLAALTLALAACNASGDDVATNAGFAAGGDPAFAESMPGGDAAGGAAMPGGGTTAMAAGATGGMQPMQIIDQAGFGQPMVAATVSVPAGWRAEGGVGWNRSTNCVTNQLQFKWRAVSPDGSQAFEILPGFNWQVQGTQVQMNPCPVAAYSSTKDFLQAYVQKVRPGARILQYRDRPDFAQKAAAQTPANPQVQIRQDSGQVLIGYEVNGQQVRELLSATVAFSQMQGNIVAGTGLVYAQRAPNGRLDFSLSDRVVASLKPNPEWLTAMRTGGNRAATAYANVQRGQIDAWNAREMARITAKGEADRAAIRANTARDIAAINQQTYNNTQLTNDHIHQQNMEGIGEYNTYIGTDGNPVQSSIHGGDRVLQMDNGDVFSTDDPNFNPAGSTELEQQQ